MIKGARAMATCNLHRQPSIAILSPSESESSRLSTAINEAGYPIWQTGSVSRLLQQLSVCDFGSLILDADILSPDQLQLITESCDLKNTSILIISSDTSLGAELVARRSGASMFFRRPIEMQHVIESLRLLHPMGAQEGSPVWTLDTVESTLCSPDGISIKLTQTELAFLKIFAAKPMEVVPNAEITDNLFKEFDTDAEHRLAMLLTRLRRKLKFHGLASPIRSVFGKGRVFAAEIAPVDKQRKGGSYNFNAQSDAPIKMSSNYLRR